MATAQDQYDEAIAAFSRGDFATAAERLEALLARQPDHFEAHLALGLAYYRLGDAARAIAEGHKAEQLQPAEPRVHTNLSLFYLKAGDKARAEHHGARARMASWRAQIQQAAASPPTKEGDPPPEAQPAVPVPEHFPDMPWKKKAPAAARPAPAQPDSSPSL